MQEAPQPKRLINPKQLPKPRLCQVSGKRHAARTKGMLHAAASQRAALEIAAGRHKHLGADRQRYLQGRKADAARCSMDQDPAAAQM